MGSNRRLSLWVTLVALMAISAVAGNAVAAERTVLGEYFNATW